MIDFNKNKQSGFTAAELLITLFIGAAFIATGYQLYAVVVKDGATIRARAKASSVAETFMRKRAATVTACSSTPLTTSETIPENSEIVIVSITTVVSSAYTCQSTDSVIKVTSEVVYKSAGSSEEVNSAIYISR